MTPGELLLCGRILCNSQDHIAPICRAVRDLFERSQIFFSSSFSQPSLILKVQLVWYQVKYEKFEDTFSLGGWLAVQVQLQVAVGATPSTWQNARRKAKM